MYTPPAPLSSAVEQRRGGNTIKIAPARALILLLLEKQPPLTIDVEKLREALEQAEKDGTPSATLKRGLDKLEYAERRQAAARLQVLADMLNTFVEQPLLEVDLTEFELALIESEEKGVEEKVLLKAGARRLEAASERRRPRAGPVLKLSPVAPRPRPP